MQIVYLVGRIAFVSVFLVSGIFKLMDIAATASLIESKIAIPEQIAPFAATVTDYTGLTVFQLAAIVLAVVEIVFALFIAFNIAIRSSAFILAIVMAIGTYYVHDIWNMAGEDKALHAQVLVRNVAIIGGLLMMMAIGPWTPPLDDEGGYVYQR